MGYQSIMLAVLASILLGIGTFSLVSSWDSSTNTVATEFEREQAVNVSNSGVNLAVTKLRLDRTWRAGFTNFAVANGQCTLRVTDCGQDSVRITSQGRYQSGTHTSVVRVALASIFPKAEAALAIYGDSVSFDNSGKAFSIDGRDYRSDGTTLGTGQPLWGMGVYYPKQITQLTTTLTAGKVASNVNGKSGTPSVGQFMTTETIIALRDLAKGLATITLSSGKYTGNTVFGTLAAPEVVYVPGDIQFGGNVSGAGILVVDGNIEAKGTFTWKGIVIALSSTADISLGGSGTPNFLGTTYVGSTAASHITNVHINGNPYVRYSADVLNTVISNLSLQAVNILDYYE
jgi:hypothetical protein